MNSYKLRVLFVIGGNRARNDGKAPLYCRLTFNKKRKQFATGQFITPSDWSSKYQLVEPPNDNNYITTSNPQVVNLSF